MILKLAIYVDVAYEGDPAMVPLIKSFLENETLTAIVEGNANGEFGFNTEDMFEQRIPSLKEDVIMYRFLKPTEVRLKTIQLIQQTQANINKKKQAVSSTKKTPSKKKVVKP